jgi:DNA-binding NtrC family response regulator
MSESNSSLAGTRILLVEDDFHYRPALERLLRGIGAEVESVGTVREALAALADPPDIIILDVKLPDGSGLDVADAASRLRPPPRIIATSGYAQPAESFRLARLNVQQYLPKPYGIRDLLLAVDDLRTPEQELAAVSARAVGQMGLVRARNVVRDSMVDEALSMADGNRTQAAKMLGVTRQAVQSAVRD